MNDKELKYVGNYRIVDLIGKGGMSKLFTAVQAPLDRVVVVKEMNKSSGAEFRKRFKSEALITAALDHPNIVSIYDYFSIGQSSYLVMQHVDGSNLADIIESEAPLHPVQAAVIAREICLALEHAHRASVIHRDVKPTNVLVSKEGNLKVTDFGVAKDETARDQTHVGTLIGTPCYMSPEQAAGGSLTSQSDIFSVGIVLYEMVTGVKPFWGETAESIIGKIARGKYRSPLWLDPHHSLWLARIINRALRKNLGRRYRSAEQLARDLEKFAGWKNVARSQGMLKTLVAKAMSKKHATTVIRRSKSVKRRARRKRSMFSMYVLLFFVVAAFIYVLFSVFGGK